MFATYRAVQVTAPGTLEMVERAVPLPASGEVLVRVEACGVCRTDAATVQGGEFPISYPRVPGHEVVGRIEALGDSVAAWSVGQRVGVGFLAGPCNACAFCRRGDFTFCERQEKTGVDRDGGYAEMMLARASGLIAIPDDLGSAAAAPLLCAGITVFSALRRTRARPGDTVAIHGIGGLGHLAVQYAHRMGFRTVALGLGAAGEATARELGAHHYIDGAATDPATALTDLGGAAAIVTTIANARIVSGLIKGLAKRGELVVLGVGPDPIEIHAASLILDGVHLMGSLTGSTAETEELLAFSALADVAAMIETMPLAAARAAYDRMMANEARYRVVLTMDHV
jgi:alcohol dehydrogenase, propanol-preferring